MWKQGRALDQAGRNDPNENDRSEKGRLTTWKRLPLKS